MPSLPRRQRVAAYAVVVRDGRILLSRLSPRISPREQWTLPGGGLDHGDVKAACGEQQGRDQPADSGADDDDASGVHSLSASPLTSLRNCPLLLTHRMSV